MPKSEHSWLVVRALDELDQICMLQEFVDMVVEQLDKEHSPNRQLKIELLLEAYQKTASTHLVTLRDCIKNIGIVISETHCHPAKPLSEPDNLSGSSAPPACH